MKSTTRDTFQVLGSTGGSGPSTSLYDILIGSYTPAWWCKLQDGSGSTYALDSAHGNNGIPGGTSFTFDVPDAPAGIPRPCVSMIDGYIKSESEVFITGQYFTMTRWFKTTSANISLGFVVNTAAIYLDPDGHACAAFDGDGIVLSATSPGIYNDGEWHMIAGVFSEEGAGLGPFNGCEVYIDGELVASNYTQGDSYGTPNNYSAGEAINLQGGQLVTNSYTGKMSEAIDFATVLTSDQIYLLYTLGSGGG